MWTEENINKVAHDYANEKLDLYQKTEGKKDLIICTALTNAFKDGCKYIINNLQDD